jgi:class 3 adenylate cyclase
VGALANLAAMQPARVVYVGGSTSDFRLIEMSLRGAGGFVVARCSPGEALDAVAARSAELILLDLGLAAEDIVRVLQAAAPGGGARSRIPVIVLAGEEAKERLQSCLQHGAEDWIATPLDAAHPLLLVRRCQLCVQRRRLREETIRWRTHAGGPDESRLTDLYTNASARFVPREFLEHLGRRTLADVKLGDHVEREMAILFADIRDFTALSERLTPRENFDFLNSYLRQVTPIIRTRRGFVDKYIGDGIMALFPHDAAEALQAAVELGRQVAKYNRGRRLAGYAPISIGVGLHRGNLILGTIGEEERMQTTVIADAVNVASRIEGLTKTFGVPLLVSRAVVDALAPREQDAHRLRHLGAVKAKGKAQSVDIFECYDNDPEDLIEHKAKTAQAFAAGMAQFHDGYFITAGRIFTEIAAMHAGDTVAAYYRDRCALTVVRERGPGPWDGAERIEVK